MSQRQRSSPGPQADSALDLSHLRREVRTALELAIVALSPPRLIQQLSTAAGLLEALSHLPVDVEPVALWTPKAAICARTALAEWAEWRRKHLDGRVPQG